MVITTTPTVIYPTHISVAAKGVPVSSALGVGEAAKRIGVRPTDITRLFYVQRLRDDLCPIVGGRRLIPEDYLPVIAMELRRDGKLPPLARGACK